MCKNLDLVTQSSFSDNAIRPSTNPFDATVAGGAPTNYACLVSIR